jgi:hypothetical protein
MFDIHVFIRFSFLNSDCVLIEVSSLDQWSGGWDRFCNLSKPGLIVTALHSFDRFLDQALEAERFFFVIIKIPEAAFLLLHTTPARMGQVAAAANVKTLVLSHLTPNTEPNIGEMKKSIRAQGYVGKIKVAEDLKIFNLGHDDKD